MLLNFLLCFQGKIHIRSGYETLSHSCFWNSAYRMHIFDNDNFSIIPKPIFLDNDNLPISCKNADISAIDNFFDNIAHPYSRMILFLFYLNFFSFTFWDLFYFSGRSSNQPLLCLHISSKVSQEKDFATVLNSKQLIFFFGSSRPTTYFRSPAIYWRGLHCLSFEKAPNSIERLKFQNE